MLRAEASLRSAIMTVTALAAASPRGGRLFDLVERAFLLVLGVSAFVRLGPSIASEPQVALILISEGLAVAFILLRKPALNADFSPWAATVAFVGTAAPLLVTAPGQGLIPATFGAWLMMAGVVWGIGAKVALNRSFGLAAANRGVKRAGPYRVMRHPMYAGYALTQLTFLLLNPCIWNLAIYALSWSVQVLRIRAEERVLLQDPEYQAYAGEVRFRLLPGVY
jgi:protein-S-isoprenylcysteine O-methyltransferase Ste14